MTRGSSRSACCASASSLPAKGLSAAGTEVLNKNRPPASLAGSGSERSAGRGGMEARTRAASIWPFGLGRSGLTEKFGSGRAVRPPSRPLGNRRKVGDPGSRCAGCQVWYKNLDQITYAKLKLGQTGMQATYALVSPNVVRWITTLPF